eukprot:jgi/Picsp_1/4020/NSC_01532-R1_ycii-related protein
MGKQQIHLDIVTLEHLSQSFTRAIKQIAKKYCRRSYHCRLDPLSMSLAAARVALRFGLVNAGKKSRYHNSTIKLTSMRTMAAASEPDYHVLQYTYVPDILEKRGPYRAEHLEGAKKMADAKKLVMAGALADPVDGALFIFRDLSKEDIEEFAKKDPYVINGLVTKHVVRKYMVVAQS